MKKVLFLYTELAPYVLACLERLVADHPVEVHLVRLPVNKEAPFQLRFAERITVHDRDRYDDAALLALVRSIAPDIAFASGWVDKGYLRACKALRRQGVPTVMCSDTAWRGDARQWAAVIAARIWLRSAFNRAWVTGEAQAAYARKLGFRKSEVRTGFYAADVDRFTGIGEQLAAAKAERSPHRFLCVARYIPTKGQQLLCDAFAALCDAGDAGDWDLWIAGTGELHEAVMASPAGRHPRIRHLGFVQAERMGDVVRECGVFVLPSTYEPWGVVVQEMACAGLPLLLSSAVGARERFLRDLANGLTFQAGDAASLRTMLRLLVLSTDDELRAMGAHSRELGRAWTPKDWAATAMDLLNEHDGQA